MAFKGSLENGLCRLVEKLVRGAISEVDPGGGTRIEGVQVDPKQPIWFRVRHQRLATGRQKLPFG
jgi:hypothetical protein